MHDLDWPTPTLDADPFDDGPQLAHIAAESMPISGRRVSQVAEPQAQPLDIAAIAGQSGRAGGRCSAAGVSGRHEPTETPLVSCAPTRRHPRD